MPCKHEGGLDSCRLGKHGRCLDYGRKYRQAYLAAKPIIWNGSPKEFASVHGASAEKLVTSRLLKLGLKVWEPAFEGGEHDLYFHADNRGWTVQVKMGRRQHGGVLTSGGKKILSDILALVWLPLDEIRWVPRTSAGLPEALSADPKF
jgi:hypothetical protein